MKSNSMLQVQTKTDKLPSNSFQNDDAIEN